MSGTQMILAADEYMNSIVRKRVNNTVVILCK